MQNVIVGSFLLLCSLPIIGGGMRFASDLAKEREAPVILNMAQEPLWTTEVKRIDPNKQAYERLPADSNASPELIALTSTVQITGTSKSRVQVIVKAREFNSDDDRADEWCSRRYRSYVKADKSYQPFGGGPRMRCTVPAGVAGLETIKQAASSTDSHVSWCISRYRSYRAEDNSYQPFSGPRRQCQPGFDTADRRYSSTMLAQQVSN